MLLATIPFLVPEASLLKQLAFHSVMADFSGLSVLVPVFLYKLYYLQGLSGQVSPGLALNSLT